MSKASFNPNVHGARGLFSLFVFVFHVVNSELATLWFADGTPLEHFLRSGKFGVELFFGISGIVIASSMARSPSAGRFLFDRYARILPVLWASIIVMIPLAMVSHRFIPQPLELAANFLAPPPFFNVLLIHAAAWSLGYEFTFYAICAVALVMHDRPRLRLVVVGALSAAALVCYPRALFMLAGVLIARGSLRGRVLDVLSRFPTVFLVLFLSTWRVLEMGARERTSYLSPLHMTWGAWLQVFPYLLGSAALGTIALLGVERGHGPLGRLLRTQWMQWLGTISYSFYIWHPITLGITKHVLNTSGLIRLAGPWAQVLLAVAAMPPSLVLSYISQKTLEVQITRWLKSLLPASDSKTRPSETPASTVMVHVHADGQEKIAACQPPLVLATHRGGETE
jgi:peptidoglycan/LPS O-acetylase OafA/YrhL